MIRSIESRYSGEATGELPFAIEPLPIRMLRVLAIVPLCNIDEKWLCAALMGTDSQPCCMQGGSPVGCLEKSVRFDDRLATVLARPVERPPDRVAQWRQLLDLLAQRAADASDDRRAAQPLRQLALLRPTCRWRSAGDRAGACGPPDRGAAGRAARRRRARRRGRDPAARPARSAGLAVDPPAPLPDRTRLPAPSPRSRPGDRGGAGKLRRDRHADFRRNRGIGCAHSSRRVR